LKALVETNGITSRNNEIKYMLYLYKELHFSEGENCIFNYQIKVFLKKF
jgi:hypothetical protein